MANWWDSYLTDTPDYLNPNLTGGSSAPTSFYDPTQSWSYYDPAQTPVASNWWDAPQYNTSVSPATTSGSNWWDSIANNAGNILSVGTGLLGSYLQGQQAQNAAGTSAQSQIDAARIAAEAQRFRPVGVTTRFGSSNFGYDQNGNLVQAGYSLAPDLMAQQNALMAMSPNMLSQFADSRGATAPMLQASQRAMALGNGYLATTPQEQAAKYMAEQQALLAPGRERDFAALQNTLQQQGRSGLAVGGTSTGMMPSNPQLEAYYNAQRMQDLQLAAQATQGGQQYAQFGTGLVGTGGDLLKGMYGTQTAAFVPYQTALGGAQAIEGLGQNALDLGTAMGQKVTTAAGRGGELLGQGMLGAAKTMQPANSYSPWADALFGVSNAANGYTWR